MSRGEGRRRDKKQRGQGCIHRNENKEKEFWSGGQKDNFIQEITVLKKNPEAEGSYLKRNSFCIKVLSLSIYCLNMRHICKY